MRLFLQTRIFVTNAINWLPSCDTVAYMEQGRISELGNYEELVDRDERFGDFLRQCELEPGAEGAGVVREGEAPPPAKERPLDRDHELSALRRRASQRPPDGNISQSMEAMPVRRRKQPAANGEAAQLMSVEQFQVGEVMSNRTKFQVAVFN